MANRRDSVARLIAEKNPWLLALRKVFILCYVI